MLEVVALMPRWPARIAGESISKVGNFVKDHLDMHSTIRGLQKIINVKKTSLLYLVKYLINSSLMQGLKLLLFGEV